MARRAGIRRGRTPFLGQATRVAGSARVTPRRERSLVPGRAPADTREVEPTSTQGVGGAVRTGLVGAVVAGVAFFDGVFIGAPVAVLAAALRPVLVYPVAVAAVSLLAIGCSAWLDRRWDDWSSGHGKRLGKRLESMRRSRLMQHPVAWLRSSSDRRYALAAALVNPILVVGLTRTIEGRPVGRRRIVLGSIAYAVPYVAIWTLVGIAFSSL